MLLASAVTVRPCRSNNVPINVLVVYTADSKDATKTMAQSIAVGARAAGATVQLALAGEAKFADVRDADAIALGSGVYNGNVQPDLLEFVDSWDFSANGAVRRDTHAP